MASRKLELTIISAENLPDVRYLAKMQTRAIAWIDPKVKKATSTDQTGGANPVWNDMFVFYIPSYLFMKDDSCLTIEIQTGSLMGNKHVGKVIIPLMLLDQSSPNEVHYASYYVQKPNGQTQGKLYISYRLEQKPDKDHIPKKFDARDLAYYKAPIGTSPRSILKKSTSSSQLSPRTIKKGVTFQDVIPPSITSQEKIMTPLPLDQARITNSISKPLVHHVDNHKATKIPITKEHADFEPKTLPVLISHDTSKSDGDSREKERLQSELGSPQQDIEESLKMITTGLPKWTPRSPHVIPPSTMLSKKVQPIFLPAIKETSPETRGIERNLTMGAYQKDVHLPFIPLSRPQMYYSTQTPIEGSNNLFVGNLGRLLLS